MNRRFVRARRGAVAVAVTVTAALALVTATSLLVAAPAWASSQVQSQPLPPPGDVVGPGRTDTSARQIGACINSASQAYGIPPIVLVILLHVEGGKPGAVHPNTNGTVDIGPMQINQIWLPTLARHWNASVPATYAAIKDDFCANVAGGAWILHRAIDDAHGHLWLGVSYYHSHTLGYEADYLRAVLREVRHLQAESRMRQQQQQRAGAGS